MAADGRIVIDVILDDGSVVQGLADINGQFGDLDRNGNSKLSKIGAGIKNLAKLAAIGVAGIAGLAAAVGAMTGPLAQAAASANALSSQFEQVFGDLASSATTGLNNIAEQTNILPERLKGSFTQMAAFAKTTGLDTAGALALTERATLAAADSAAFYDKSIEEVTESLQSFLKGNFENDAALGISATETTRNAKANELYGKSFIKLDEAQKQLTLLAMVEDGNKLSGALGQAAREGESLENVTGNLKQAWENLKAQLGQHVLQSTIDGIVLLTKVIQNFDIKPFVDTFNSIKSFVTPIITSFVEEAKLIISTLREHWASNGQSIIDNLRSTFESIQEAVVPRVNEAFELIKNVVSDVRAVWEKDGQAIIERLSSIFQSLKEIAVPIVEDAIGLIVLNFRKIKDFWETDGQQLLQAISNVFQGILEVVEFIMPAVKFVIDYVWTAIKNIITGALDVIMGAIKVFSGLFTGDTEKMWEGVKQLFKGAIDLILGWMSLTFIGGIRTALVNLGKAGLSIVKGMWDDIAKLFTGAGSLISNTVSKMATSVVNFFKNIWTQGSNIFGTLKTFGATTFEALKQAVTTTVSKLVTSVVDFVKNLSTNFVNTISSMKTKVVDKMTEIKDGIVNKVKEVDLVQVGKDIVQGLINGIGAMTTKLWDSAKGLAETVLNALTSKSGLDTHSPSKKTTLIGQWVGDGLANGVSASQSKVAKAMESIGHALLDVTKKIAKEEVALSKKLADDIAKVESNADTKIYNIKAAAKKKKRDLTVAEKNKIIAIEKEEKAKIAELEAKYAKDKIKAKKDDDKAYLETVTAYIDNKKSLDQMSLVNEALIWEQTMELFDKGTTERIKAQQNYQKAVEAVQKELVSINETYSTQIQNVHDEMAKQEETLTKAYEDAVDKRAESLVSFKNLFDEFKVEIDVTGEQLLANLGSQVQGFKTWQKEVEKLSEKAIDKGLLEELRQMGPNALPELIALNQLTDAQLKQYSDLYKEKSSLARKQAETELVGMKNDTDKQITELRSAANKQLDLLKNEWDKKIKALTKGTATELSSLKQVGKDAGQGLLEGLTTMEGPLQSKARAIAESIKGTIQKALDIRSPSRWMRDFIAGNMAKGYEIGVDKNENVITKAAANLGEMMKPNIINPLRGVSLNLGNLKTPSSVSQSTSTISHDNRRSNTNQITNYFTPAQSTPSESARKQEQMLRRLAMEY